MNPLVALSPLVLIVTLDGWVYTDARSRHGTDREVRATIGSFEIDTPELWLTLCLLLFVLFFPMYLVARRELS